MSFCRLCLVFELKTASCVGHSEVNTTFIMKHLTLDVHLTSLIATPSWIFTCVTARNNLTPLSGMGVARGMFIWSCVRNVTRNRRCRLKQTEVTYNSYISNTYCMQLPSSFHLVIKKQKEQETWMQTSRSLKSKYLWCRMSPRPYLFLLASRHITCLCWKYWRALFCFVAF